MHSFVALGNIAVLVAMKICERVIDYFDKMFSKRDLLCTTRKRRHHFLQHMCGRLRVCTFQNLHTHRHQFLRHRAGSRAKYLQHALHHATHRIVQHLHVEFRIIHRCHHRRRRWHLSNTRFTNSQYLRCLRQQWMCAGVRGFQTTKEGRKYAQISNQFMKLLRTMRCVVSSSRLQNGATFLQKWFDQSLHQRSLSFSIVIRINNATNTLIKHGSAALLSCHRIKHSFIALRSIHHADIFQQLNLVGAQLLIEALSIANMLAHRLYNLLKHAKLLHPDRQRMKHQFMEGATTLIEHDRGVRFTRQLNAVHETLLQ
mmetsp:Transcript_24272/g.39056  ORF Transcript_24272/g.39056 Transcript_24272/m.39056 type:complete len:314 (+) Transcript_24272:624-1565(+)